MTIVTAFGRVLLAALLLPSAASAQLAVLEHAHAHNDYQHARPLYDALERGFNSIEADVHLVDGQLLVAHHRDSVVPSRTLESLYLAPLRAHIQRQNGRVYPGARPLTLLIDVKGDSDLTYAVLDALLRRYADILTIQAGAVVIAGPVAAVISGNRAIGTMRRATVRFAALDGRISDLADTAATGNQSSSLLMPLISDSWQYITKWKGVGPPPIELEPEVARIVRRAHERGQRVRFWGTPDNTVVWRLLRDAGVDLINADDLDALRAFLTTP